MDHQYGVGVLNRYALLLDDEADLDALKQRHQKDKKRKTTQSSTNNQGANTNANANNNNEKENKVKPEPKPQHQLQNSNSSAAQPAANNKTQVQNTSVPTSGNNAQNTSVAQTGPGGGPPRRGIRDQQNQNGRAQVPNNKTGTRTPYQDRSERPDRPQVEGGGRPPRRDLTDRPDRPDRRPNNYERRPYNNYESSGADGERRGPPRERGTGRGGPGGTGGTGRGGYDNRGKREFDRRSGSDRTGVKPVDKRDGGGPHNWGSHKDDLDDFNKTNSEGENTDQEKVDATATPVAPVDSPPSGKEGGKDTDEESPKRPVEEEPKELTLDEWKALRGNRQKPQYNLRKAGEGEDLSQWKDMVALTKEKTDGEDTDEEYDSAEYPQRVGRQKRVLGIEFAFYEPRRGGGAGRGGRGRGRGGGPRPRRDDAPVVQTERVRPARQNAPKVDDNKDFPSLG